MGHQVTYSPLSQFLNKCNFCNQQFGNNQPGLTVQACTATLVQTSTSFIKQLHSSYKLSIIIICVCTQKQSGREKACRHADKHIFAGAFL